MTTAPVDGRTLRGLRTRRAVAEAYLLLLESVGEPRFEQVAEQAGVGLRTVYNQFSTLELLRAEAGTLLMERLAPLHRALTVDPDVTLAARVRTFVEHRVQLLERLAPFSRAVAATVAESPELRRVQARFVAESMAGLTHAFGVELARVPDGARVALLQALHVASTHPTWQGAREELGLDAAAAADLMVRMLTALLGG